MGSSGEENGNTEGRKVKLLEKTGLMVEQNGSSIT